MDLKYLQKIIDDATNFLTQYRNLSNAHTVNFFLDNSFENILPAQWRSDLQSIPKLLDYIGSIFGHELEDKYDSDLAQFVRDIRKYSLSFLEITHSVDEILRLQKLGDHEHKISDCESKPKPYFLMKEKKSYEVEIMSKIVGTLALNSGIEQIIDIGSGKGYLGTKLVLDYGLRVLGIDSNYSSRTLKIGAKQKKVKKLDSAELQEKYHNLTKHLTSDLRLEDLLTEIGHPVTTRFILIGLHTCGNLASTVATMFSNSQTASILCYVMCCYNLLQESEDCDQVDEIGFPLSQYLQQKQFKLGRNARMLGCQSLDRILHFKKDPEPSLFYRAVFQVILKEKYPYLMDKKVGRLSGKAKSFPEYVHLAMNSFKTPLTALSEEEIQEYWEKYESEQTHFHQFINLRYLLAPVIEAIIILDKLCFLREQGVQCYLTQLLDPIKSPRSYAIIAFKE